MENNLSDNIVAGVSKVEVSRAVQDESRWNVLLRACGWPSISLIADDTVARYGLYVSGLDRQSRHSYLSRACVHHADSRIEYVCDVEVSSRVHHYAQWTTQLSTPRRTTVARISGRSGTRDGHDDASCCVNPPYS